MQVRGAVAQGKGEQGGNHSGQPGDAHISSEIAPLTN